MRERRGGVLGRGFGVKWVDSSGECYKFVNYWLWGLVCFRERE